MDAKVAGQQLSARIVRVTTQNVEIGITNNNDSIVTIDKIAYVITGGSKSEGELKGPWILKRHEEIKIQFPAPFVVIKIHLTIYGEDGKFIQEVTLYAEKNSVADEGSVAEGSAAEGTVAEGSVAED